MLAEADGQTARLEVWDDGPGFTAEAMIAGHGLDNLQARLKTLFGDQSALEIRREDEFTVVRHFTAAPQPSRDDAAMNERMLLRIFLVDDETLALKRLARLLRETGRVEIIGQETGPGGCAHET